MMAFVSVEAEARIHTVLTTYTIAKYKLNYHNKYDNTPNAMRYNKLTNFSDIIAKASKRHHVDENLIRAIIKTESGYSKDAVSPKGAVGIMQLMPDTAKRFGCQDRKDPIQNIDGGTKYLKYLLSIFDDIKLVVAAYNAGENAVIRHNNKIPPYPETQTYVKLVMARL